MMRRVPGTPAWHVFKDGAQIGDVVQSPDGSWTISGAGIGSGITAPTRKEAARQLTGDL